MRRVQNELRDVREESEAARLHAQKPREEAKAVDERRKAFLALLRR
jgi:hypothetical protein